MVINISVTFGDPFLLTVDEKNLDFSHMPYFFRLLGLSGFLRYDF